VSNAFIPATLKIIATPGPSAPVDVVYFHRNWARISGDDGRAPSSMIVVRMM
jgi:hypothetical protein